MSSRTLKLRPALLPPARRREIALAATVLLASAAGGALIAVLQAPAAGRRVAPPIVLSLPVPTAVAGAAAAPVPFDLAPVIDDGGLRVVLATAVEPHWLGGAGEASDHDGVRVVVRPLSETGRARFARLDGTRLRLIAAGGGSCTAEVTGVVAVGRFAPDGVADAPDPEIDLAAAWAVSAPLIAGDLRPLEGDCAGAAWAQPASLAPPVQAAVAEADPELARRAASLLRESPDFADLTGGGEVRFEVRQVTAGAERLLVATALAQGCAGFEPVTTSIVAIQPDGSLHPVGGGLRAGAIEGAADFDGDGHLELLVEEDLLDRAILRRRTGAYAIESRLSVPIFGCRC